MKQIKSKARVSKFGEVFTAEREVKAMCDLIPAETWENIESSFLEPACGNGNFLVEIFARKLKRCKNVEDGLKALSSIYGIDIQQDNVEESKLRLFDMFVKAFPKASAITGLKAEDILQRNILCGDSLEIMRQIEAKGELNEKVEKNKLKPCPFCGATEEQDDVRMEQSELSGCFHVVCYSCGIFTDWHKTEAKARKSWNRRTDNDLNGTD